MDNIEIRLMSKEDAPKLAELYNQVWPGSLTSHYQKAKWALNTTDYPGVCAENAGEIIGSRSCFKTNTFVGQKKIECVQLGDTCVKKEFRGLGLLTSMNKFFLEKYYEAGGDLIYNYSVEASKRANIKMGWIYLNTTTNLIYINHPFRFIYSILKGVRSLGGARPSACKIPDISMLPESLLNEREMQMAARSNGQLIHSNYDRETLEMRLKTNSGIQLFYTPKYGACFFKRGIEKGLRWCTIGEIFLKVYDRKHFDQLFKELKKSVEFDVINVIITYNHPLFSFYKKRYFFNNPKKKYLNHGVKIRDIEKGDLILNSDNWALTTLDIDTF